MSTRRSTRANHSIISISDSEEEIVSLIKKETKKRTFKKANLVAKDEVDVEPKSKQKKILNDHKDSDVIPSNSKTQDTLEPKRKRLENNHDELDNFPGKSDTRQSKRKKIENNDQLDGLIPSKPSSSVPSKTAPLLSTTWEVHELLAEQFSLDVNRCRNIVR